MSVAEQVAEMVGMLPDDEQVFALEFVKRLVLAWDPDFTKLTESEKNDLEEAQAEYERGETIPMDAINWK